MTRGAGAVAGALVAAGLMAGAVHGTTARPEPAAEVDWVGAALTAGVDALSEWDPATLLQEWSQLSFDPADLDTFWRAVETALTTGNLDDFAELDHYAHDALAWMDATPELEPMADWFRQRLDYFDVAATLPVPPQPAPAVRPPKPVPPPPAARPTPTPTPSVAPAPSPAPASRTVAATRSLGARERKVDYWKRKLKGRKVPASRTAVIPRLKEIFREEGVPEELVWMAETESTLNPAARSPAGAVGLFQFMPATAGRFGLKVKPRDERLEPDKSARAAAKYLRFLNGQFQDWPLALAAYNAGEGRVGGALKRSRVKTFEGAAPHLPPETQLYVPKVLATIALREGREFDGG